MQQERAWPRQPASSFASLGENDYSADPPPAYDKIGPSAPDGTGGCFVVRDTRRWRSFGIGGAGNIRTLWWPLPEKGEDPWLINPSNTGTTMERSIVAISAAAAATTTPSHRPGATSSGASDLRDRILDGVRTMLSSLNGSSLNGNRGTMGGLSESVYV